MVIMQVSSLFLAFVEKADMNLQQPTLKLKQVVFWEFCEANGASPTEASNIVSWLDDSCMVLWSQTLASQSFLAQRANMEM